MLKIESKEDARYVNDCLDSGLSLEQAHAQLEVMREQYLYSFLKEHEFPDDLDDDPRTYLTMSRDAGYDD